MKHLLLILSLTCSVTLHAQEARVIAGNYPGARGVQIKYYVPQLYVGGGVNIYRKQPADAAWTKINPAVLIKGAVKPTVAEIANDRELRMLVNMLDSASQDQLKGLVLLSCLVKSFQSEPFSRYLGILYEDGNVQSGSTYEYQVRTAVGREEVLGTTSPVTVGTFTLAEPPASITMSVKDYLMNFSWKPETDRYFGVNVYRQISGEEKKLITRHPVMVSKVQTENGAAKNYTQVLFTDDSLQAGKIYAYELAAVDFFGREGKHSTVFKAEIKDITPPIAPDKLEAEADNAAKQTRLKWRKSTSADLAGYHIYRSKTSTGTFDRVNKAVVPADRTEFTDPSLKPGGYYYSVSAVDKAGNETPSGKVFVELKDIIPPAPPAAVVAKTDTGKIVLTWNSNKENDLRGYQVYRSVENKKDKFVLLNATAITATQYSDPLPGNVRNKFFYSVVALDSAFNKSEFSAIASAKLPDITAPAKLFIKNVTPGKNALAIEWLPVLEKDVKHIIVYRTADGQPVALATLPPKTTRYEDNTVMAGTSYAYFLNAVDSVGNVSENSNTYTASLPKSKSMKTIAEMNAKYDSLKKTVTVTWMSPENTTGFVVYRKEDKNEFRPLTGLVQVTQFVDGAVSKGKIYAYRVKAFDKTGVTAESLEHSVEIN